MKRLRALFMAFLLCGLTHLAKADDFKMVVIDSPPTYTDIFNPTFVFGFSGCDPTDPTLTGFSGCFVGKNLTGNSINTLSILVPNTIGAQTADCTPSGLGLDLFNGATCGPGPGGVGYILNFTGGDVPYGGFFTIAESGADPDAFGDMTGVINASTPEPASLWLACTGVLLSGIVLGRRRDLLHSLSQG